VVTYRDPEGNPKEGAVSTIKVRTVADSELGPSFICLSDFVWASSRLANPAEDALKARFADTRRLHLSVFMILSIAELGPDHPGLDLEADRSNLVVLPPRS
jgi:hypothetical protein